MRNGGRRADVLFLTQAFPPESFAGAHRAAAMAGALSASHDLVVITLHPGHPDPASFPPDAASTFDATATFRVERRSTFSPSRHRSTSLRACRELVLAFSLGLRGARRRADVIIASSPPMFLGPVAFMLARLKRALFVWDLRDVTWEVAGEIMGSERSVRAATRLVRSLMWGIARRCDLVLATTPGIEQLAREAGVVAPKIITVENGISETLLAALRTIRKPVPKDHAVVTYVGLVGKAQRLAVLLDVAERMGDVEFLVAGDGPEREALQDQAVARGLSNIHFLGYVRPEDLPEIYRKSDVLFAQVVDCPTLNRTARPTKLLEYMAAGRPVVYAGRGDAAALVKQAGGGVCTSPGDADEIVHVMTQLLIDPARLAELGSHAAAFADALASREERMQDVRRAIAFRLSALEDARQAR